ncbi:unnamed protein product [Rodentolepis nana]|uniref:Uncharacterized protein n=1 Tax=Rodentolepis nana TaxID=102285 RepID=A0A3P7VCS1_RODNA|nr:unnamed protein product [Rodentolepis nana]
MSSSPCNGGIPTRKMWFSSVILSKQRTKGIFFTTRFRPILGQNAAFIVRRYLAVRRANWGFLKARDCRELLAI